MKRLSLSVLFMSLCSAAIADQSSVPTYTPVVNLSGNYGNQDNSAVSPNILLPVWQTTNKLAYIDLAYWDQFGESDPNATINEDLQQFSVGVGARGIINDQYLVGTYAFLDRATDQNNNAFYRTNLGAEFETNLWSAYANIYLALPHESYYAPQFNQSQLVGGAPNGFDYLSYSTGMEQALSGGDVLAGINVPGTKGLSLYGGWSDYLSQSGGFPNVNGPMVMADYHLAQAFNIQNPYLHNLDLIASWQHNQYQSNNWTVGMQVGFSFGAANTLENNMVTMTYLQKQMTATPMRQQEVMVVGNVKGNYQLNHNADGSLTTVAVVNNDQALNQYAGAGSSSPQPNWVLVNGSIDNSGNALELANNVGVTGQGIVNNAGWTSILSSSRGTLTGSWANNDVAINLGQNNTVRDLNIIGTAGDGYIAIRGGNLITPLGPISREIGNTTITGINTNGTVGISPGGDNNYLTLTNNVFTGTNNMQQAISLGTSQDDSVLNVEAFAGNTVENGTVFIGPEHVNSAVNVVNGIVGNTIISNNRTNPDNFLIQARSDGSSVNIGGPGIANNTIIVGNTTNVGNWGALTLKTAGENTSINVSSIQNNTITTGTGSNIKTIAPNATDTINIGNFIGNTLNNNSAEEVVIYNRADDGGTINYGGNFANNVINDANASYFDTVNAAIINDQDGGGSVNYNQAPSASNNALNLGSGVNTQCTYDSVTGNWSCS